MVQTAGYWLHIVRTLAACTLLICIAAQIAAQEICDNSTDDDDDGLADLNDPDCDCLRSETVKYLFNPSFEEHTCCPLTGGEVHCADHWIQASVRSTDFLHTCDWLGWNEFQPPEPFPDGNGIIGFRDGRVIQSGPEWNCKEYVGQCLKAPLMAGRKYRLRVFVGFIDRDISPPVDITLFGTPDCSNLPFGGNNQDIGCPTNAPGWTKLASSNVGGTGWVRTEVSFTTPSDIHAIALGPDCPEVPSPVSLYYFLDNVSLAEDMSSGIEIGVHGDACKDFFIEVPSDPGFDYQWYRNGIAIPNQTLPAVLPSGPGGFYQVRLENADGCYVTAGYTYIPEVVEVFAEAEICLGAGYTFGSRHLTEPGEYRDTVVSEGQCDTIITLTLTTIDEISDTLRISVLPGESITLGGHVYDKEGNYVVPVESGMGCDRLTFLQLREIALYIPNIFSPNDDGVNDRFALSAGTGLELKELQVFDRWGSLVHVSDADEVGAGWDGRLNGKRVATGTYLYRLVFRLYGGEEREVTGAVTVVR